MADADHLARAAHFQAEALRAIREEEEFREREAARDRCDQCPEPKSLRDEIMHLPNGIQLSLYASHCQRPGSDCTALVSCHILSEAPEVGNRIIEWLVQQKDLNDAGVGWTGCFSPGAESLILTCRVPILATLAAAAGAVAVDGFRKEPPTPPCERCGKSIASHRLAAVPDATRCLECQELFEGQG